MNTGLAFLLSWALALRLLKTHKLWPTRHPPPEIPRKSILQILFDKRPEGGKVRIAEGA